MGKEDIILFGASKLGQIAYIMLKDKYNIIHYCDNDNGKIGEKINGIEVIDSSYLAEYSRKIKVIITSHHYKEISMQLINIGFNNFEVFSVNINPINESNQIFHTSMGEVNLGSFLKTLDKDILLNNITFSRWGSYVLDYVFLKALALKFNVTKYLEIGSYIGESIDAVATVVNKCYSISLPDEELAEHFEHCGKSNFSSFFMHRHNNVIQYKGDSKTFDYSLIDNDLQLIFIDGDHSYNGVYIDTKNIFNIVDVEDVIVVWHDFKTSNGFLASVVNAVYDALPSSLHDKIYYVDNNLCGIYIPDKYIKEFSFSRDRNLLYSYEMSISVKENIL